MQPQKKVGSKVAGLASQKPSGLSSDRPAVPEIVRKSRGVAYNVQMSYANWHEGMRKLPKAP